MITVKRMEFRWGSWLLSGFSGAVLLFLVLPMIIVIPMSFSSASTIQFPPTGFSLRWYEALFGNPEWVAAAQTSILIAFSSSIFGLVLGVLATYGLAKGIFPGRNLLLAQFAAPMIVPTIITAVALYINYAQIGLLGKLPGLIMAHTIIVVPYVVLILFPIFESFDKRLELAARSLGASWFTAFRRVILPNLIPSIAGAWFFAFIMSFDELIVTIFLSGEYMTIPKKMFNELVLQINPTITAISTILIAFTALVMTIISLLMRQRTTNGKTIKFPLT